jgi:hypothetical protein
MTAGPRTFPIRVPPVPGEALDSWQESLAARLQATPGDIAAATAPSTRPGKAGPASVIMVSSDDAAVMAASCGLTPADVHGLTLARFDGTALRLDRQSGRVVRNVLWGRAAGSRFCPRCLAETGGRWKLAWRLSWSFACLDHGLLLTDACPECGRMQRLQPHPATQVPRPGTCACPGPGAIGVSPPRCGAGLTAARTLALDPGHPVLAAQQFINRIIAAGHADAGIYASSPQPADAALADVRFLAATILRASSPGSLASVLPADITAEYAAAVSVPHESHGSRPTTAGILPGSLAPASAAVTAAAVTAAAGPLASEDLREAASGLRRTFRAEETRSWERARAASPALQAVRLTALGRATEPPAPGKPPAAARARARQVPALFWPAWTARLLPHLTGTTPQERRRFLPAAFIAVTAGTSMASATQMLGSAIAATSATRILQRAERDPRWPASVTAITLLAGWLDQHGAPIDYQRRRRLDYGNLLPGSDWALICHRTGTVTGEQDRALTARRWLFERISGTPAEHAPSSYAAITADQRHRLDKFAVFVTPDLAAGLDHYTATWLAGHRIDAEEATWRPPAFLLTGLDLPGPDPFALPPTEIHELVKNRRMSPRAAALRVGTTIDVIRAVLDEHPAPSPPLTPAQERARGQAAGKLREHLSPDELNDLYTNQRMSLEEIGRRNGASKATVTSLAREYGIRRRPPAENRPPIPVDRDWLCEQYMTRNRPLADIAAELGVTVRTVNRWVKTSGIPFRGRADRRHHSLSPTK